MRSAPRAAATIAALLIITTTVRGQATAPHTWRVRLDGASRDTVAHQQMPPGWHVTTGPAALLYDPAYVARGRYALGLEVFVFPSTGSEELGIFAGGEGLDGASASYVAFVLRRPGEAAIVQVRGGTRTMLSDWTRAPTFRDPVAGNQLNTLRVGVERDSVRFELNGARVATVARGTLPLDGTFGIRAGAGVNLHLSNLDVTQRLAPAPAPRRQAAGPAGA